MYRDSDRTLHVLSCKAEFRMTESVNQVTIVAAVWYDPVAHVGALCQVLDYTLAMHAPLGNRRVIDGITAKETPVQDWDTVHSTAPETPAPLLPAAN